MTNARDKANIPALNFSSTGIDDNASSTVITIESGGDVGIGTTNPAEKLQVMDTASNIPKIRIETSDGGNKRLDLSVESSVGTIASSQSAQQLAFKTAGGEAVRIDATGQVGIGTSSPAQKLHILSGGTTYLRTENTGISTVTDFGTDGTGSIVINRSAKPFRIFTNSTERVRIDNNSGDRVFIGTTSDVSHGLAENNRLIVSGYSGNGAGMIGFVDTGGNTDGTITVSDGSMIITADTQQTTASSTLQFRVDNTERVRIDSDGSVGIGTTSPFNSRPGSLTVSNDTPTIYLEDTNASGREVGQILYNDTNLTFSIGDRNGTGTTNSLELLKINNAGKIFTRQTAQFDDCVTIGGAQFTGDFQIELSGLTTLDGNSWRQFGIRLTYAGTAGDLTNEQHKDVFITVRGLSSWSSITPRDSGGGTIAVTLDSSTTTASTFTVTTPGSTTVGAYVATLFANDNSTMECNG